MSTRFGPNFPRVFAAAFFQEISFALFVHFPGYLEDLGATAYLIGLLYGAAAVFGLLLRPALGRVLDLTHRRTVLLVSGGVNTVVLFALTFTTEWGWFLWGLFLAQRLLQIAIFTAMLTYGADSIPPKRRTQGLAVFGLSGLIPIALSGVLGDWIIASYGFVGLFLTAALAEAVAWVVVLGLPTLPVLGRRPRRGFWAAVSQRNLLPLWLAGLCFAIGLETVFTFTRVYIDARQVGTAGLFFGVYGATAAATRLLGGSRYDRLPQRPLIVLSILAYAAGLALMALAESAFMLGAAALVAGLAHGAIFPILTSQVVHRSRTAERGSAMSIFTSLFEVSVLLAAPAVGFLIDGFSFRVGFGAAALTLVLGAVVYAFWDARLAASERATV
jgi:MFS family permease